MKKSIELQVFRLLSQPSLVDILFLLNEQERSVTHLAGLLEMNTADVEYALQLLVKQGLVRQRDNNSMGYIYEITSKGRQIFDSKRYRIIIILGISAFIVYSLGLIIFINCFSSPIYDVSFMMQLQDEITRQQLIIGGVATLSGLTVGIYSLCKLIYG
ncbi:MAG: hypothetical protein A4E40_00060 [Methanoregulaceae archaeon PtaU1.Bin059]|nr:MAG: hypothetical protein A4E40_00060 [Methanoregulaceae archaeon PtaU1.Bin059]